MIYLTSFFINSFANTGKISGKQAPLSLLFWGEELWWTHCPTLLLVPQNQENSWCTASQLHPGRVHGFPVANSVDEGEGPLPALPSASGPSKQVGLWGALGLLSWPCCTGMLGEWKRSMDFGARTVWKLYSSFSVWFWNGQIPGPRPKVSWLVEQEIYLFTRTCSYIGAEGPEMAQRQPFDSSWRFHLSLGQ